jgi:tetratricopeptide (TPR) repeat protein
MDLSGRTVALYGRFTPGVRERLKEKVARAGGDVLRDLTRRSDLFVVGALAAPLIDSGALQLRLEAARARGVPILGERAFADALSDEPTGATPTLSLSMALAQTGLSRTDADILAAFDLIRVEGELCCFADAGLLRTAADLIGQGRSRGDAVRILARARDLSPRGRHRIIVGAAGEASLQWDDGSLSSLEGQGYLALDEDHPSLEDLFEAAGLAEATGQLDEAARLYDQCARADRRDAIALFNLGNIRFAQRDHDQAALAYQRALARDAGLIEARYNLAQALEAAGKLDAAAAELNRVLDADPGYADAVFNLAQLKMNAGDTRAAKALFERYLALGPPDDWAATARKAILVCSTPLSA